MKYYIDTEFIEYPHTIDLISIGIKCEDGRTFYAESTCFDERKASDWVKENVIAKLRWYKKVDSGKGWNDAYLGIKIYEVFGTLDLIRDSILEFISDDKDDKPEFWGYYADYDWVVFCWIFGSMIDLPEGWPMYCKDLKQLLDESVKGSIPDPEGEHNALVDAIWNEDLHKYLME
jgi:hypothetical protein